MKALLEADTPVVTLVGKTSELSGQGGAERHAGREPGDDRRFGPPDGSAGRKVVYDAEHFFDTFRANPDYALRRCWRPTEAGASVLALCDTNGGTHARADRRGGRRRSQADRLPASASTRTTTPAWPSPTPWRPSAPGPSHARARSTASANAAATWICIALVANLQLKYGIDCLRARHAGASDRRSAATSTKRPISTSCPASRTSAPAPLPTRAACTFTRCRRMSAPTSTSPRSGGQHAENSDQRNVRRRATSPPRRGKSSTSTSDKATLRKVLEKVQELENAGLSVRGRRGELRAAGPQGDRAVSRVFRAGSLPRGRC